MRQDSGKAMLMVINHTWKPDQFLQVIKNLKKDSKMKCNLVVINDLRRLLVLFVMF